VPQSGHRRRPVQGMRQYRVRGRAWMGSRMGATPQGALQVMQWSQRGQFMVVGREARSPV